MITVRPLTSWDILNWYGSSRKETIKGYAAEMNGKLIGIGGVAFHPNYAEAFSEIKPEFMQNKKALVKAAKKVRELFKGLGYPILAVPDDSHPNAAKFLEYLGFEEHEGVYIWRG